MQPVILSGGMSAVKLSLRHWYVSVFLAKAAANAVMERPDV